MTGIEKERSAHFRIGLFIVNNLKFSISPIVFPDIKDANNPNKVAAFSATSAKKGILA